MGLKAARILCVDDEPHNLELLEAILVPRGYEVFLADTGKGALERIRSEKVDLVLLDVMMPGMNGYDVCKAIHGDERHRDIPVVMITSLQSTTDRVVGIEAGAADFVSKPFAQPEILARIKMLLQVKSLNDRLKSAYHHIGELTRHGEEIAATFDPNRFDLLSRIDRIVITMLRENGAAPGKPRTVVVGVNRQEEGWEWCRYRMNGADPVRKVLPSDLALGLDFLPNGEARTGFLNRGDLDSRTELPSIVKRLRLLSEEIEEMVYYQSSELCLFALDYGAEVGAHDTAVLNNLALQSRFLNSLSRQVKATEEAFVYLVHALARAAEANDEDTWNHIVRVGEYCALIATELGMAEPFVKTIRLHAPMHDVGKIHVDPSILRKPGKLTPEEWVVMKQHPVYGAKILGDHPRLALARSIALSHHERWNGSGYPNGLKGTQIPVEGRILNLADQYDALRNRRVYKPAIDHDTACRIMLEGDGRTDPSHFDPEVHAVFRKTTDRFGEIYEKLRG